MSDYLDRIERQLVARADALYAPGTGSAPAGHAGWFERVSRAAPGLGSVGLAGYGGRWRRGGSWSVAGVAVAALGGLAAALIMSLGAAPASSDFTVARGKGGVVTIKAGTSSTLAAVNSRLARLGIRIRVARGLPNCGATRRGAIANGGPVRSGSPVMVRRLKGDPGDLLAVRVRPPTRPGLTLLLAANEPGGKIVGQLIPGSTAGCAAGAGSAAAALGASG